MTPRTVGRAFVLAAIATACGADPSADLADTTTTTASTAVPTSAQPTTTSSAPTSLPTTTARPPAVTTAPRTLSAIEMELPPNLIVETTTMSDSGVIVVAGSMVDTGAVIGRVDRPLTAIADFFPDQPFGLEVSDIVWFGGRFYGFLMGNEQADPTAPTMLVSADGASWSLAVPSVVVAANARRYTPESPPYPGPSGVVDAAIRTDDVDPVGIVAVGWAELDGVIRPVLWETIDGDTWKLSELPDAGFETAYGAQVESSQAGTIVVLGGPIHFGVGAFYREGDSGEWKPVPTEGDDFVRAVGAGTTGFHAQLADHSFDSSALVFFESGTTWSSTDSAPESVGADTPDYRLSATSWHDPVLVRVGPSEVGEPLGWVLDRGRWTELRMEGDWVVSIDADHISTTDGQRLFIHDRRAQQ